MDDGPRQKLREMVAYDRSVVEDSRRCRALLLDLCGDRRREIRVLVLAVEERVAADLRDRSVQVPAAVLVPQLTRRLVDDCGLTDDVARWAVESWALALHLPIEELPRPSGELPPPAGEPPQRQGGSTPPPAKPAPKLPVPFVAPGRPTGGEAGRRSAPTDVVGNELRLALAPGVELVFARIPAGEFRMGSDKKQDPRAGSDEMPQHTVYLDEYWMAKYPVTNAQYRAFVQATGHRRPSHWQEGQIPAGKEAHPVVHVSWHDAAAFGKWVTTLVGAQNFAPLQIRLPTEAEWEKAARGTDGRLFPWGDEPPAEAQGNLGGHVGGDTTPVGRYSPRGDSPYGCADMAGNVWEWCADWYGSGYYRQASPRHPLGPAKGTLRVVRGGAFTHSVSYARCAYRFKEVTDGRSLNLGFRVVWGAPPASGL